MFYGVLRKVLPVDCTRCCPVLLKLSYSDSAVARTLPKLKAITDRDFYREYAPEFRENFIQNLFINKFQEDVLEYPEVDTLEDVDVMKKHFFLAEKLITSFSDGKEVAPLRMESKNPVSTLKNFELAGFKLPRLKNGFGYLQSEYTFLQEALGLDPSLSKTVSESEDFGIQLLNSFGSDIQKERYLHKLSSGEVTACLANIEPGNVVSFETDSFNTTASLSSDTQSYVISGTKTWVYNAESAGLFILLANVTSNNGEEELKPTLFLIDKDVPGIEIHEPVKTVGLKSLKISDVSFNNVVVPKSCVLGNVSEGDTIIKKILSQGKLCNGGHCLPIMRKFIDKAIQHCIHNEFFKIDKHEKVYFRRKIGKMVSRLYVVESMTYLLTGRLDSHKNADVFLESLIVKIFASESLHFIVQEAVEILGTEFFTSDNLMELSRDSQFYAACDDSNNYLRLILSTAGLEHAVTYKKVKSLFNIVEEVFNVQTLLKFLAVADSDILISKNILKGYLHPMFSEESIMLEDCVYNLSLCTQHLINTYGENVFERYRELYHLADIVINIYAILATLARGSRAYCIGVKFQEFDRNILESESRILTFDVKKAKDFIFQPKSDTSNFKNVGSHLSDCKYSKLHPVLRNLMIKN